MATRLISNPFPSTGERLASRIALLARNQLFRKCSLDELGFLAATAYPMSFQAGEALCVEGTDSPECYVVAEGHAVVTIGQQQVANVDEEDVVGERGILLDTVRAATVIATSRMITWAISRDRLQTLVEDSPTVRNWMLDEVRRHYPRPG